MWNYRLFQFEDDKEKVLYISECYYDDKGKINGYVNPKDIFSKGFWDETKDGMQDVLDMMKKSTMKNVIIIKGDESFYEQV